MTSAKLILFTLLVIAISMLAVNAAPYHIIEYTPIEEEADLQDIFGPTKRQAGPDAAAYRKMMCMFCVKYSHVCDPFRVCNSH